MVVSIIAMLWELNATEKRLLIAARSVNGALRLDAYLNDKYHSKNMLTEKPKSWCLANVRKQK